MRDIDRAPARPVDCRVPDIESILREVDRIPFLRVDLDQRRRGIRRRHRRTVQVCREHAAPEVRFDGEHVLVEHPCGAAAAHHRVPLEREHADSCPAVAGLAELVDRDHVRVLRRPHAELWIVVQVRRMRDVLVRAPRSGRIARRRVRDALVEGPVRIGRIRKLRCDPAVGELVVEDDRVAAVPGRASADGQPGEELIAGRNRRRGRPVAMVDPEGQVDPLHVVVRADVALGVRRRGAADVVHPSEVRDRARHLVFRGAALDERAALVPILKLHALAPRVLGDLLEHHVPVARRGLHVADCRCQHAVRDLDGRHWGTRVRGNLRNGRAGCHSPPNVQLRRLGVVSRAEYGEADGDPPDEDRAKGGEPETHATRCPPPINWFGVLARLILDRIWEPSADLATGFSPNRAPE